MKKQIKTLVAILFSVLLLGCSDGRPSNAAAQNQFEQRYPSVKVVSVHLTQDEVIARSYLFRYRKLGRSEEKEIEIQFMENPSTKQWGPRPEPPKDLP